MPRLIIRKSALSTTHYCRRWFPGNSAKTQRRKALSDDCYSSCSDGIPPGTGGKQLTGENGRGRAGELGGIVVVGGALRGLITSGVCVLLNICRWFRRSRCALLVFLLLFFTLTFFKLTSTEYDSDLETIDFDSESDARSGRYWDEDPAYKKGTVQVKAADYRLAQPNCEALEKGDEIEIRRVEDMLYKESRMNVPNSYFRASTTNCSKFRELRNYADRPNSAHELQTPLAYVIGVKRSAEQVERLLRAVYAPQNLYCLYSLRPSNIETDDLDAGIEHIAGCFSNVFLSLLYKEERTVKDAPLVAPYRACLETLLAYRAWRYVLLTSEGDFPLKTNAEIIDGVTLAVASLRNQRAKSKSVYLPPLRAANDFSGYVLTRRMAQLSRRSLDNRQDAKADALTMHAQPGNTEEFMELKIRLDSSCPDGKQCVLTSADLHWLLGQQSLFARRFDLRLDYVVIACLENLLRRINSGTEEVLPAVGA